MCRSGSADPSPRHLSLLAALFVTRVHNPTSRRAVRSSCLSLLLLLLLLLLSFDADARIYDNSSPPSLSLVVETRNFEKSRKSIIIIRRRGASLIRENIVGLHGTVRLYGRNMERKGTTSSEYRSRLDTCRRLLLNAVYKWAVVVWARFAIDKASETKEVVLPIFSTSASQADRQGDLRNERSIE